MAQMSIYGRTIDDGPSCRELFPSPAKLSGFLAFCQTYRQPFHQVSL
jgi:hypothetical protein